MTLSNSQSSSGTCNNDVLIRRAPSNSRNCNSSSGSRRNNSDRGQHIKNTSFQYHNKTTGDSERNARTFSSTMLIGSTCSYDKSDIGSSDQISTADNHEKAKDTYLDNIPYNAPEAVDPSIICRASSSTIRRYTRSALYLLRNDTRSRCRPKCASKLQLLCIWKTNNTNFSNCNQQNGGNSNSSTASNLIEMSSSPRMNSITRQQSNHDLQVNGSGGGNGSAHQSNQKNYLDHRSISSSHLMPAFAKRRIGNSIQSHTGGNSSGGSHLTSSNDSMKLQGSSGKNNDHKQFLSPQRKNANINQLSKSAQVNSSNTLEDDRQHDRERGRDRERDANLNPSISASSNARERRFGSGRLLPRDVNWDFRSDKDANSTSASTAPFDKDLSSHSSGNNAQRLSAGSSGNPNTSIPRFDYAHRSPTSKDRSSTGSAKNAPEYRSESRYESRRTYARDYERDSRGDNSNYVRRFMSDLINQNTINNPSGSGKSSSANHGGQNQENRRRNHRNDEPEWFSSGPTSQHDTIELRGFDEVEDSVSNSSESCGGDEKHSKGNVNKQSTERNKAKKSQSSSYQDLPSDDKVGIKEAVKSKNRLKTDGLDNDEASTSHDISSPRSTNAPSPKTHTHQKSDTNNNSKNSSCSYKENKATDDGKSANSDIYSENKKDDIKHYPETNSSFISAPATINQSEDKAAGFNFDAFLNADPLSNLLMGEQNSGENEIGSRFSRWFVMQGDNHSICNDGQKPLTDEMVSMLNESQVLKNEREPHAATESRNSNQSHTLMEFLQRGKINATAGIIEQNSNVGSIPSVEELEARMRKIGEENTNVDREQSVSNQNDNMENPLNQFLANSVHHHHQQRQQQQQQQQQQHHQQQQQDQNQDQQQEKTQQQQQQQHHHHQQQHEQQHRQQQQHHQQQQQQRQQQKHIQLFNQSASLLSTGAQSQQQPQHLHINQSHPITTSQTQDMEAFKKLLEQITPNVMNTVKMPTPGNIQQQMHLPPPTPVSILPTIGAGRQTPTQHLMKKDELSKFIQQQQLHQRRPQHSIPGPQHTQIIQSTPNEMPVVQAMFLAPQQRFEAQLLLQGLSRGEVTQSTLGHQLSNPNTSPRTKEVLAAVLRESSRDTSPNVIMSAPQIMSPVLGQSHCTTNIPPPPPPILIPTPQQIPFNHPPQSAQQSHPTNATNTGGLPQRIPSPRELQYHTQSIMQNALIKKKLEEQQENYRRRQEIQKHQMQHKSLQSPSHVDINEFGVIVNPPQPQQYPPNQQHTKKASQQQQIIQGQLPQRHVNSPTPLAFTPTSVLRKMTAEKDSASSFHTSSPAAASTSATTGTANTSTLVATSNIANNAGANNTNPNKPMHNILMHYQQQQTNSQNQPRMILGIGSHSQQQQQQGLPIAGPSIQQQHSENAGQSRLNPTHRNNPIKWSGAIMNQISIAKPMGRPILKGSITQPIPPPNSSGLNPIHQQQSQSVSQPPQMAFASKIEFQQIQQQRATNNQSQQQQQPHPQKQQQQSQNIIITQLYQQRAALQRAQQYQLHQLHHQQQQINTLQNNGNRLDRIGSNANTNQSVSGCGNIINYQRDGGLSPTSNQLARWFSPELLAQASAGKLPPLNMNQALSLEEFEKSIQHSSTAVNN